MRADFKEGIALIGSRVAAGFPNLERVRLAQWHQVCHAFDTGP